METWLGSLKAITGLDARNGEKTNSATDCLVVIVIRITVEIQRTGAASIKCVEDWSVRNIESIIRAGRTDWKSSPHLGAHGYFWQDAMVNTYRAVRQFVNPLRLEALHENVTGTEEFSDAQRHIIVEEIRDLGVHQVYIRATATRLDLEPAVKQEFRGQLPKENGIERGRKRRDLAVARLEHAFGPAGEKEFGGSDQGSQ